MNNIRKIINSNDLSINKFTIKKNVTIINTDENRLVFKKKSNDNSNIINYLKQRGFDSMIEPIIPNDEYNIYQYLENIDVSNEQKGIDIINLITNMHNKTTIHKEVTIDFFKEIYEDIDDKITYLFNYYNDVISIIEKEIYMAPSHYLFIRNISKLYACFDYLKNELDEWYKIVKEKKKARHCVIHNNLELDHLISNINKNYLINFDNSKIDLPIYDIYNFYKKHFLTIDFKELLLIYEKKFPLLEEERKLLFILISLPEKLTFNNSNELESCKKVRLFLDYLYKNEDLISPYYETNNTQ